MGTAEKKSQQVAAARFDDRPGWPLGAGRMGCHGGALYRDQVGGPVGGDKKPRSLEPVIEGTMIGAPQVEPVESEGQGDADEQLAPVVEPDAEIRSMYLDLGQPEQGQPNQLESAEIGVVVGFDDIEIPLDAAETGPPLCSCALRSASDTTTSAGASFGSGSNVAGRRWSRPPG